jgi:hypothetical protein
MSELNKDDIKEIRSSPEHKDAFTTALEIHQRIHDPDSSHFRNCTECKSGYALLLISNLRNAREKTNER